MSDEPQVYRDEDFMDEGGTVHGLRCAECETLFVDGQPIAERLEGFMVDTPVVRLICVSCSLGGVHA